MKKYSVTEYHNLTSNQDVIALNITDAPEYLTVLRDNVLLSYGDDYTIENNSIKLNQPQEAESNIKIVSKLENESRNIVSRYKSGIYKQYNDNSKLLLNNKYDIYIDIDNEQHTWQFNTKLNPLFCSVKKIISDIGEFIQGYSDEYILDKIYQNSVAVLELVDELKEEDIENVSYTQDVDTDLYDTKSRPIKDWVRYKTEIDLIMARYYGISYAYGSVRKELGDISIERSTKLPYIDNLLDRIKDYFEEADDKIRGVNIAVGATRAGDNYQYTEWERTTIF